MSVIGSNILAGSAGSGGDALYVDDVFSTYLYDGTGAAQTITNGIDLSGEGGMVWTKSRSLNEANMVFDTERGVQKRIFTNSTSAESTSSDTLTAFNSDGFTIGTNNIFNANNSTNCSWTFRKAPGFFDVVTWTGNGTAGRTIAHNLGSVPGMIIIKSTTTSTQWIVYHRGLGEGHYLFLEANSSKSVYDSGSANSRYFNNTAPTSTEFTLSDDGYVNNSTRSYVAYVFAHNDQSFGTDSDEAIVHCGTFNGGGVLNSNTIEVNTGFEPQFVLIKRTDSTSDWYIYDTMRGMDNDGNNDPQLLTNKSDSEVGSFRFWVYQNGFAFDEDLGGASAEWIYMAIRRPNKPPEAGTDVFTSAFRDSSEPAFNSTFPVDLIFEQYTTGGISEYPGFGARLTGKKQLTVSSTASESTNNAYVWDYQDGWNDTASANFTHFAQMFKRALGFMDVALYTGTGSAQAINHNLGVAPEFIITKVRSNSGYNWLCYHSGLSSDQHMIVLNGSLGEQSSGNVWNNTAPTATQFSVNSGENNYSGQKQIAVLFASLDGISKVGSYTGTGSDIDVDCGFTAGARYILIKRVDDTGDWYVWDSLRGIYADSTNDPYLLLNSSNAHQTSYNYVDALNAGFTVNASAPAALNASGGTYAFLAIA